ncbi:MAG TPA: adenine deaminase [Gaiellales bacterium]|nr:adenine deaminase [Gaiellales bacterium]
MSSAALARRIEVARGDRPADLVVRGGSVLSVFTREWLDVDVAVCDGVIAGLGRYDGERILDATGRWVVPGYIDAHVHIESSQLLLHEFARLVLPLGTTAVVADPHEIANVLGTDGVHWLADTCRGLPLSVFLTAPSCVPASIFESPLRALSLGDLEALLRRSRVIGLGEMMNFPGVITGDPQELAKLGLEGAAHVDGHAPAVVGRRLQAYAAAGIRSDHEARTAAEGRERLRAGMWVLLREASGARNLRDLLPLVHEFGPARMAFCTDDREPAQIVAEGHIDSMVRTAVAGGVAPADALTMASHHAALWHGLDHLGALAPGYRADLLLLSDLESFRPELVLTAGREVAALDPPAVPDWTRHTVRIQPLTAAELRIAHAGGDVRVIGVIPGQIVTESRVERPRVEDGAVLADPDRDLAKIAVVERHLATGRVGLGLVSGFRLRRGALASTVAHDAHNIVCVGVDDGDMVRAVRRLEALGGGMVAVAGGHVRAELPLPVAGLLSDAPFERVLELSTRLSAAARELGCGLEAPFHALGFLALSVIPALKITDRGLVDVDRFELVPLAV